MLKPTSNYKMSKRTKRMLCTTADSNLRNSIKACMIQAELSAAIIVRTPKSERTPQKMFPDTAIA
jgi:hypothetical protein